MVAALDPDAREKAARALAAGLTDSVAARLAGYSPTHIARLKRDKDFMAGVEAMKSQKGEPANEDEKLALDTLREMAKGAEKEADRITAAKELLRHSTVMKKPAKPGPQAQPPAEAPAFKIVPQDPNEVEARLEKGA